MVEAALVLLERMGLSPADLPAAQRFYVALRRIRQAPPGDLCCWPSMICTGRTLTR